VPGDVQGRYVRRVERDRSNQRETLVLWDESGEPLCNAVVWQCKRSVDICDRLKGTQLESQIQERTGLIVDPYFSGTKLIWLCENDPRVEKAIRAGKAFFGTVDTWLLYKLTSGRSYLTDHTNASRTLLFNIHRLDWDTHLLAEYGLAGLQLPQAEPSACDYGVTDFEGLLPKAAIGQDQAIQETTGQAWAVKHEGDCLWRFAKWLLSTFCGEESPATLAQSQEKRSF